VAINIDVGDHHPLNNDAGKLHAALDSYGIANSFEVYPGDHTSGVAGRVQDTMMPFFSRALAFGK
jgi:hypothetical protein